MYEAALVYHIRVNKCIKLRGFCMYIIAGLGNPESKYKNTRHNIGFDVIDKIADETSIKVNNGKFKALCGQGLFNGHKVVLLKPLTYMNLSGESIREAVDFYKIDPDSELIVFSDDINLEVGNIRIRKKGSAGGHNGLKNIIKMLGTDGFSRIRMGVGHKPEGYDLADYVLGHFSSDERKQMDAGIGNAIEALKLIMDDEFDRAMNEYNRKC